VIDALISNICFFPIKMFAEMSQEEWQRVIDPDGHVPGYQGSLLAHGRSRHEWPSVGSADVQGHWHGYA